VGATPVDARRTKSRPGPADRSRHPAQRGGLTRQRRLDPAGRAERARGVRNRRLRLCARNRRSRARWRGGIPARQFAGAGQLSRRGALTAMASRIAGYEGVAVAVPVTVPYERFSIRGAHWFMARALKALVDGAGISKDEIDGLCVASFTLAPDSAVGLTQHLGMSPRWLDHIPMGGASAIVSLRRAARAVQSGDAEIVACIAGDTNQIDSFRQ